MSPALRKVSPPFFSFPTLSLIQEELWKNSQTIPAMLVPAEYRERRIDSSDEYGKMAQSSLDDPYMVDISNDQRKAAVAILEAILEAMTNDEMKTSQEPFTTTGTPLRSYHSSRNDGPDIVMMLISGFVLVGLVFVVGIFISLLR